ncbi:alpha/beta hydrolase [Microbacterium sp. ZXX196]|uniref:alpha/beta hydrolase n=1 Tax=Microbacterium sp. ZXX196 TaxID=2609291 RepID=UPI0012BA07FB|nr:alpha/beta hydrolase [Microbacterium sp. ZXX196]MTE22985.1 alpha/beta hydrolase [Microbacterium sp. ZXX196]
MTRSPRRRLRILAWTGGALGALVLLAVAGTLVWTQVGVMAAEPGPLAEVTSDPEIVFEDLPEAVTLTPTDGASGTGLVFVPGAKVEAAAYAARLADLVREDGVTVVITKPVLNIAFFDLRPLETFTELAPGVETWAVGGHSLGGVRACQLAPDADALVLFASYCANDLSGSELPVLSLAGSEDGLSTPEKVADARDLLPPGADMVEIAGAAHASFGDYGPQPGDGVATIDDEDMTARVTDEAGGLLASLANRPAG